MHGVVYSVVIVGKNHQTVNPIQFKTELSSDFRRIVSIKK